MRVSLGPFWLLGQSPFCALPPFYPETESTTMAVSLISDAIGNSPIPLSLAVPAAVLLALVFFLRPRYKGGADAPPMVTTSPVSSIPIFGPAIEFGKSPVKMVKRCYDDYGPVFTAPVRFSLPLIGCYRCSAGGTVRQQGRRSPPQRRKTKRHNVASTKKKTGLD